MRLQYHHCTTTASSFVHDGSARPVASNVLLRAFDHHRRELAVRLVGREGSGAGYDTLRVDRDELDRVRGGDRVTVTALLGDVHEGRHLVNYVATATDAEGRCSVLVEARGWTLFPAHQSPERIDERS